MGQLTAGERERIVADAKSEWQRNPKLHDEFLECEDFAAWKVATAMGLVRALDRSPVKS